MRRITLGEVALAIQQLEQLQPGISKRLKAKLVENGMQKIAEYDGSRKKFPDVPPPSNNYCRDSGQARLH